jgi:hypothetical protein
MKVSRILASSFLYLESFWAEGEEECGLFFFCPQFIKM